MCQVVMEFHDGVSNIAQQAHQQDYDPGTGSITGPDITVHRSVGAAISAFQQEARSRGVNEASALLYPGVTLTPDSIPFRELFLTAAGEVEREVL